MISILVPFRGDAHRWRLWEFVWERLLLEMPDAELIMDTDDGRDPFNKSMAVNAAARRATGDVFCILDADCLLPPMQLRAAVEIAGQTRWVRPWSTKVKLSLTQTEAILEQNPGDWDGTFDTSRPDRVNHYWAAPPLVIPRTLFEDVGGMDERYRGWGGEDAALAKALFRMGHRVPAHIKGTVLHLWHPLIGEYGRAAWEGQSGLMPNLQLDAEYRAARTRDDMRALIERRAVEA